MQTIIFFDLDSTLVENRFSRRAIGELLNLIAEKTGEEVKQLAQDISRENSRRQQEDPDNFLTMDWDDIVDTIARRRGIQLPETVLNLWNRYANASEIEVLDQAPGVLKQLKTRGRKIVIATKGLSKYQLPVLRETEMIELFDDILTPDYTGFLKTSRNYFHKYLTMPDVCFIQVGDHYYDDVICAKRNGFYAILRAPISALADLDPFERPAQLHNYATDIHTYPDTGTDVRPDAVVISLEELPEVIARIEAFETAQ